MDCSFIILFSCINIFKKKKKKFVSELEIKNDCCSKKGKIEKKVMTINRNKI